MDDAATGEAVLLDDMLHDAVVAMRVDAQVRLCGRTELDDAVEYAVNVRITGYAVDDVIGLGVEKTCMIPSASAGNEALRTIRCPSGMQ